VNGVCCQVEVSVRARFPVQENVTKCVCVFEYDRVLQ